MSTRKGPAAERRRLTRRLRELRNVANLTQADVAAEFEWSQSKINRIENGDVGITRLDLQALLGLYGVTDQRAIGEIIEMAKNARQQSFSQYRDILPREFIRYLEFEVIATVLKQFEPLVVPGLLQTPDYARATLRSFADVESLAGDELRKAEERIERKATLRIQRQQILLREECPLKAHFIVDESVLYREVGAERGDRSVMSQQLRRLLELSERPNIEIQILRLRQGAHPGMRGPFSLLEFEDEGDDPLLYVESTHGDIATRDEVDFSAQYLAYFEHLKTLAVSYRDYSFEEQQSIGAGP